MGMRSCVVYVLLRTILLYKRKKLFNLLSKNSYYIIVKALQLYTNNCSH